MDYYILLEIKGRNILLTLALDTAEYVICFLRQVELTRNFEVAEKIYKKSIRFGGMCILFQMAIYFFKSLGKTRPRLRITKLE